jgi:hypothetical protein
MLLVETAIFYLLIGAAVAVAVYVRGRGEPEGVTGIAPAVVTGLQVGGACLFWPLFVPMLLSAPAGEPSAKSEEVDEQSAPRDGLALAISQVEGELDAALEGLDGWAEDVLNSEQHRLEELRLAWKAQAERIRDIDRLLAEPSARSDSLAEVAAEVASARQSEQTRQDNIRQLSLLRNRMHADLVGTLAWVRELVTMIHLAKFSGAPAARAEELVAQIAAAVQGLSEVSSWRDAERESVGMHAAI